MTATVCDLADKSCKPCEGGVPPLDQSQVSEMLQQLDGWTHRDSIISKTYTFKNYWQTMAFVNAAAWVSHREDHHPDMAVGYSSCRVDYTTHAIKGLSANDFICAAKIDRLFADDAKRA
jgi:4a-hydroxytetrahydrobiopterin dehydratase